MDYRTATSLGARLRSARRARGMRTTRDLAEAIDGGNVTESIIENIESGRKVFIDISQLLNIAMALELPLSYLLAPMGRPSGKLDLPNLSSAFTDMTASDFDAWLSSTPGSSSPPRSAFERAAQHELDALRAWASQLAETSRLTVLLELEQSVSHDESKSPRQSTEERLQASRTELARLTDYLEASGWPRTALEGDT